jgi:hypothetical protein
VYSERVKEIEKALRALGYEVKIRNTYVPASTLPKCPECGAAMNREGTSCYNATCLNHRLDKSQRL